MGTKLTEEEKLKRKQEKELKQIEATISNAKQIIDTKLKQYIDSSCLINTEEDLHNYISTAIKDKEVAIDTETTGLDTYTDRIVGICLYSDSQKEAYIPINHIDYKTKKLLPNQLPLEVVTKEMNRLKDSFIIMHNANFDIRVLRRIGVDLHCDWDTQIAANIINENENHKLKLLHQKYILKGQEDAFTFADLFSVPDDVKSSDKIKVTFDNIPIEIAKVYAAHDAKITKELKDWQYNGFIQYNPTLYEVFKNIEMPCVLPVCDMEDTGFIFDTEFHKKVEVKYHTLVKEKEIEIQNLIKGYKSQIEEWRKTEDANHKDPKLEKDGSIKYDSKGNIEYKKSKSEQLPDEINLNSPTQLSILFYDVLKTKVVDKKNPRGTGKEVLEKLKTPLSEALLAYRTFAKLVTSFIDSLPEQVKADGKIHCRLNQIGAACVTENNLLLTTQGYIPIQNLFINENKLGEFIDTNLNIINKDFKIEKANYKIKYINQPVIKLLTKGGFTIEGTYNHPIISSDISLQDILKNKSDKQIKRLESTSKFKQLDSLQVGNTVAIPFGYNIFPTKYQPLNCKIIKNKTHTTVNATLPDICNEEFAELLGIYQADGTYTNINGHLVIKIHNQDPDVINRVKYLAKSLFNLDTSTHYDKRNSHSVSTYFGSTEIQEIEKFLIRGARNKTTPNIIMQSPKSVISAYIKGLTLDSHLDINRQRLAISCTESTGNFVQNVLLNMGILAYRTIQYRKSEHDHAGNKVEKLKVTRLCITGEMYKKFLDEIGFIQKSKELHLDNYKKSRFLTYNNVFYSYIKEIKYDIKTVYDIHVPQSHSFICNGFINHNTGRFSCIAEGQFVECINGRKKIEDINIGDLVYCYNEDGKLVSSKVLNKFDKGFKDCYRYNFIDWNAERTISLICTPDHRILTKNNNFIEAHTLIAGDKVSKHFLYSGTNEYVNKKHVWDLEVENYHNFIVSEICVHNCDDPNLQQIPARGEAEELRQLFTVPINYREVESKDNVLVFKDTEEIEIQPDKWEFVKNLQVDDIIISDEIVKIIDIKSNDNNIIITTDNNIKCNCKERYILIGADYSQQEPKILAVACQDPDMIHAANIDKDLYSTVAAKAFHTTYEDCLEHFPEGTPIKQIDGKWKKVPKGEEDKLADGITDTYKDGKLRRKQAKTILLGLLYGRGAGALAEQLECSLDEARDIMNSVYRAFPKIKSFNDESIKFAKQHGYITTLWGKKRRLPDARLDYLDIDWSNSIIKDENQQKRLKNEIIQQVKKLEWRIEERTVLVKKYEKDYKIKIKLQSVLIARAERQVVNSIIQGSASDMTKKAIAAIANNKELKDLGFSMIVPIHDEILGQCPIANAPQCIDLFTYEMSHAATDKIPLDIKVDPTCAFSWAGEEVNLNEELERKI